MAEMLRHALNAPELIKDLNTKIQSGVPDKLTFSNIKMSTNAPDQCKMKAPAFLGGGCACMVGYDVSGRLSSCSGLNSIQLLKWDLEGDGLLRGDGFDTLSAAIGAHMKVGGVSCKGTSLTNVNTCGVKSNFAGTMAATMAVRRIVGRVSAKVAQGDKGEMCLKDIRVSGDAGQDDISWKDVSVKLGNMPFPLPNAFVNNVWNMLPLDSVINNLRNTALGQLQTQLGNNAPCFDMSR
jgi:hypothetical protein